MFRSVGTSFESEKSNWYKIACLDGLLVCTNDYSYFMKYEGGCLKRYPKIG
jgi:hypothetical protein